MKNSLEGLRSRLKKTEDKDLNLKIEQWKVTNVKNRKMRE